MNIKDIKTIPDARIPALHVTWDDGVEVYVSYFSAIPKGEAEATTCLVLNATTVSRTGLPHQLDEDDTLAVCSAAAEFWDRAKAA